MIYMDNAATTMHKPQEVIDAVVNAMNSMGNAGRGASEAALSASRVIYDTRDRLAELFGAEDARPQNGSGSTPVQRASGIFGTMAFI